MDVETSHVLSVIISVHNEERTICKTLCSLMLQDHFPFEIIVVDDGSTDRTCTKVIESFNLRQNFYTPNSRQLKQNSDIRIWSNICSGIHIYLLEKENSGKANALNVGIEFCHGEFFVCTDADCTLSVNSLHCLLETLERNTNTVAVGGRVLPIFGLSCLILQNKNYLKNILLGCQELEYGAAFCILRPIFSKIGTTMLISGAMGLFRKDIVVKLGGYASDTLAEDMELVMRIRQYAAENKILLDITYAKEAVCYTELPWKISDLIKQRIRWTVGLTEVLWKYRRMATKAEYSNFEKATYWYYLLFEKYSPHIEFIALAKVLFSCNSGFAPALIILTVALQLTLSIIGSYQSIKSSIKSSDNKLGAVIRFLLLLFFFVSVYHIIYSLVRLISFPYYQVSKRISKNKNPSWNSPTRM